MKKCFKCGEEQPLSQFYKHKQMGDGHLNKCKACTKRDVKEHREKNIERIRAYDRARGNRQALEYPKQWREKNPEKYRAHTKVNNELRAGNLTKKPCDVCGSTDRVHAHHDDYSRPLDIRWLCATHHRQHHCEVRD